LRALILACVLECGAAAPLSVAAEETQNVVRLGILFQTLALPPGIGFTRTLKSGRALPHSKTWR